MKIESYKTYLKQKPIASRHSDTLNLRGPDGEVVLINEDGSAEVLRSLDFYEECKYADEVYYPGDSITITF